MRKLALVAVLGILCSLLLAACGSTTTTGNGAATCDPTHVNMTANTFCETSITISKGSTITFTDDKTTGTEHILIVGKTGTPDNEPGAADFGSSGHTFQPGNSFTTPPWNTAGTFHVTCTIHPTTMNLTVTVTG